MLKQIVRSVEVNHPDVEVFVVLVHERPEEITDVRRWVLRGTVAATAFDRPAEEHVAVAELVVERAKRLAEQGRDVLVVLDGLTRITRAHHLAAAAHGRTGEGGLEVAALGPAKRLFAAARDLEEAGSLTLVATASTETGARADEVVVEEVANAASTVIVLEARGGRAPPGPRHRSRGRRRRTTRRSSTAPSWLPARPCAAPDRPSRRGGHPGGGARAAAGAHRRHRDRRRAAGWHRAPLTPPVRGGPAAGNAPTLFHLEPLGPPATLERP
ncbi:MAG: hypothetical protein R2711_06035 [Acidimicrobiales bacterium]